MADPHPNLLLRHLPAIAALQVDPLWQSVAAPPPLRSVLAREAVAEVRARIEAGQLRDGPSVAQAVHAALAQRINLLAQPSLQPLFNGSGVLLHTNAGRAPLPEAAIVAIAAAVRGYNTLELDATTGRRGSRQDHCGPLLCWLTGAEAALVCNNGAAAALLALRTVARGRPVAVSRGELVEIGGGFRVHEVMAEAGCTLVEVGATNRTHLHDYARALDQLRAAGTPAAAVLVVHRSNFAVIGFAGQPELADLAALAHRHQAALVVDLGSGAFVPLPIAPAELPDGSRAAPEPTVAQTLAAGADLVSFSGDKLVGGPQAGLLVGQKALLDAASRDPLLRALRPGSLTLAGLAAVLRIHLQGRAATDLVALHCMAVPEATVAQWATSWAETLRAALGPDCTVATAGSPCAVGGGTHPLYVLPSQVLVLGKIGYSGADLAQRGMAARPAVLGRTKGDHWLLDVRSLAAGAGGEARTAAMLAAIVRILGPEQVTAAAAQAAPQ